MLDSKFYRMNDGIAYIYEQLAEKTNGGKPLRPVGDLEGRHYFEYLSISAEDYRFAMQDDIALEVRIRILRDKKVSTKNIVKIKDAYFKVWNIRHCVNKQGVAVTDITLVAAVERFTVVL